MSQQVGTLLKTDPIIIRFYDLVIVFVLIGFPQYIDVLDEAYR